MLQSRNRRVPNMHALDTYKYRRKEWLEYRAKVLKRRGYQCERCNSPRHLHIHHPEYAPGKDPWEYHVDFCELLCRGCHAREHDIIAPDSGWTLLYSDLEQNCPSDPIPCSACKREITWHFTIYHPEWGEWVVGSECAERLSLGIEAQYLQSYQRRMDTFLNSPRWKENPPSLWITQDKIFCAIRQLSGEIKVQIGKRNGTATYPTVNDAKRRIFEVLELRKLSRGT